MVYDHSMQVAYIKIETYWNVNALVIDCIVKLLCKIKIETYWNVNYTLICDVGRGVLRLK